MEEMLDLDAAKLLLQEEKGEVLCILSLEEKLALEEAGALAANNENYLSTQHLSLMEQRLNGIAPVRLVVVPQPKELTTAAERGLIYAMLVRCRKVISCRDKLEDMLLWQAPEKWESAKAEYEDRVMALFKQTWRSHASYPYIIVDDIKAYNKGESYIMKALHQHLSERKPCTDNPGDAEMIAQLKLMFEEISLALLEPEIIILGQGIQAPAGLEGKIYRLNM